MVRMNEIEYRLEHAQKWQRFLWTGITKKYLFRAEWCVMIGLCETAGWVNSNQTYFLEWVKPGHKDI